MNASPIFFLRFYGFFFFNRNVTMIMIAVHLNDLSFFKWTATMIVVHLKNKLVLILQINSDCTRTLHI